MANVLGFFKKAMPFITTGLSMTGLPAANVAASILGKVFNIDNPTPDAITKVLGNANLTPELQAQLAQAELTYKQQMQALGFEHEDDMLKLMVDDRASARQMQTATKSWVPATLAILVTTGFFSLLAFMAVHPLPEGSKEIMDTMVGTLGTAWVMVVTFYFGSSAGSDRKTELMAQNGNGH